MGLEVQSTNEIFEFFHFNKEVAGLDMDHAVNEAMRQCRHLKH